MSAFILGGGKKKEVKNLGWLLTNWKNVKSFTVTKCSGSAFCDARVVAHLRDGRLYVIDYASKSVLDGWLRRSVFIDVPITWFGKKGWIAKSGPMPSTKKPSWMKD